MKQLLLFLAFFIGFFASGKSIEINYTNSFIPQLVEEPESLTTRSEESQPEYSSFYLFIGSSQFATFMPVQGENESQFIFKSVPVHNGDRIMLQSFYGYWYYAKSEDTVATEDNPQLEMFLTGSPLAFTAYYGIADLNAIYDIVVDYGEEKANLKFQKVADYEFTPAMSIIVSTSGNYRPNTIEGSKAVYTGIPVSESFEFYIYDTYSHIEMGWTQQDLEPISPSHLTTEIVTNPDYMVVTKNLEGEYNIIVDYKDDFSGATISFEVYKVPQELANYTGDLYLFGAQTNGEYGMPDYKFTCISAGKYEWKGDELIAPFTITGKTKGEVIPDTDISLAFCSAGDVVTPGLPCDMRNQEGYFRYNKNNSYLIGKNVILTLDLKEMTLTMEGEIERMIFPIETFSLVTKGETIEYLWGEVQSENELLYKDVKLDEVNGVKFSGNMFVFGWPKDSEDTPLTETGKAIKLYTNDNEAEVEYVKLNYEGSYDIYFTLNEAQTEGSMRIEKVGEGGVNEIADNEMSYRISAQGLELLNLEEGISVEAYSLSGVQVYKTLAIANSLIVPLTEKGGYIIKVGKNVMKLVF